MRDLEFISSVVNYFNENNSTVRATAKEFGISKSSVHTYLTVIMPNARSREILDKNLRERHIRGGLSTKRKLEKQRSEKVT